MDRGFNQNILFGIIVLLSLSTSTEAIAEKKKETEKETPPTIGNLALPASQQPGPFISFGERVIEKGQKQLFVFSSAFIGPKKHNIESQPGILYQATDKLSIFLNVPFAIDFKDDSDRSSGIEDVFCQFEYAYYVNSTKEYNDQATIIGYVGFPSGSIKKRPPTGFGSSAYFLGTTYSRTFVDWIFLTSCGTLITSNKADKIGNNYLYQFGIGRNICYLESQYIFNWLLEFDGTYYEKNKNNRVVDPDSGGNVVYITPSLWFSNKHLIVQIGIGFPVVQKLNGSQNKYTYLLATNIGWTF